MNNPILGQKTVNLQESLMQNMGTIKKVWGTIRNMGNPQVMLEKMLENNPNTAELTKLLQASGGDPEKAFRSKAKEMGLDPDQIISQLK